MQKNHYVHRKGASNGLKKSIQELTANIFHYKRWPINIIVMPHLFIYLFGSTSVSCSLKLDNEPLNDVQLYHLPVSLADLVPSRYTDSSSDAVYSRFFLTSSKSTSLSSSCFSMLLSLKGKENNHLTVTHLSVQLQSRTMISPGITEGFEPAAACRLTALVVA